MQVYFDLQICSVSMATNCLWAEKYQKQHKKIVFFFKGKFLRIFSVSIFVFEQLIKVVDFIRIYRLEMKEGNTKLKRDNFLKF